MRPEDRRTTSEMSLALWLRTGRAQKSLSLDDVARVTKIQPRILEQLEAGKLDNLPADVFVRGFVRSFAKCVGLDEDEALRRLAACKPGSSGLGSAKAVAVIDAMADLAPNTRSKNPHVLLDAPAPLEISPAGSIDQPIAVEVIAEELVEAILLPEASEVISLPVDTAPVNEPVVIAPPPDIDLTADALPVAEAPKKKRAPRKRKAAAGTPSEPLPVVPSDVAGTQSEPLPVARRRSRKPRGSVPPPVETNVDSPDIIAPVTEGLVAVESSVAESNLSESVSRADVVEPLTDAEAEAQAIADANEAFIARSLAETNQDSSSTNVIDAEPAATSFEWHADADSATTRFDRTDDVEIDLDGPTWTPKMPVVNSTSTPWRRPAHAVVPSLVAVIDDADPESAERALEDRRVKESRRTFLPPILLDREGDRSARQGGLTLAVIILLIAATLTLSYLMRRPSATGDGVTRISAVDTTTVA